MDLQTIIAINSIGVIMMIVLQVNGYIVRQRRLPSDRIFTAMILITSAGCATESISFMDNLHPSLCCERYPLISLVRIR